jgi:hypothetical protein
VRWLGACVDLGSRLLDCLGIFENCEVCSLAMGYSNRNVSQTALDLIL